MGPLRIAEKGQVSKSSSLFQVNKLCLKQQLDKLSRFLTSQTLETLQHLQRPYDKMKGTQHDGCLQSSLLTQSVQVQRKPIFQLQQLNSQFYFCVNLKWSQTSTFELGMFFSVQKFCPLHLYAEHILDYDHRSRRSYGNGNYNCSKDYTNPYSSNVTYVY